MFLYTYRYIGVYGVVLNFVLKNFQVNNSNKITPRSNSGVKYYTAPNLTKDEFVKESAISSPKNHSVSFTGLTNVFKTWASADYLVAVADQKASRIAGTIPDEWTRKIPKELRGDNIKELYNTFKQAVILLKKSKDTAEASEILDKAFKKAGIVDKTHKITLGFLSADGHFGDVYEISIPLTESKTGKYVLKRYRNHLPQVFNDDSVTHGNYIEANRALSQQKDFCKMPRKISRKGLSRKDYRRGDYPNMFFTDTDTGYTLFEDARFLPPPLRKKNLASSGIYAADNRKEANNVNDYHVDFGAQKIINPLLVQNRLVRYFYQQVKESENPTHKLIELVNNAHKMPNEDAVHEGIVSVLYANEKHNDDFSDAARQFYIYLSDRLNLTKNIFNSIYFDTKSTSAKAWLLSTMEHQSPTFIHDNYLKITRDLYNNKNLFTQVANIFSKNSTISKEQDIMIECFENLLNNMDIKNKNHLNIMVKVLQKISNYPERFKVCAEKIVNKSDGNTLLNHYLEKASIENEPDILPIILKHADDKTFKILISKYFFKSPTMMEDSHWKTTLFNWFDNSADKETVTNLLKALKGISEDFRSEYFKKGLIRLEKTNNLSKECIWDIMREHCPIKNIPEQDRAEIFDLLWNEIEKLPIKDQKECIWAFHLSNIYPYAKKLIENTTKEDKLLLLSNFISNRKIQFQEFTDLLKIFLNKVETPKVINQIVSNAFDSDNMKIFWDLLLSDNVQDLAKAKQLFNIVKVKMGETEIKNQFARAGYSGYHNVREIRKVKFKDILGIDLNL